MYNNLIKNWTDIISSSLLEYSQVTWFIALEYMQRQANHLSGAYIKNILMICARELVPPFKRTDD